MYSKKWVGALVLVVLSSVLYGQSVEEKKKSDLTLSNETSEIPNDSKIQWWSEDWLVTQPVSSFVVANIVCPNSGNCRIELNMEDFNLEMKDGKLCMVPKNPNVQTVLDTHSYNFLVEE